MKIFDVVSEKSQSQDKEEEKKQHSPKIKMIDTGDKLEPTSPKKYDEDHKVEKSDSPLQRFAKRYRNFSINFLNFSCLVSLIVDDLNRVENPEFRAIVDRYTEFIEQIGFDLFKRVNAS